MNNKPITLLDYGFPNICKPLLFPHLRSLIVGDFFRRLLTLGSHTVLADLHPNDIGTQIGSLIYFIKNHQKEGKKFRSMAEIYKAFFFVKKLSHDDPTVSKEILKELILCQNNADYMGDERDHIYQLFLDYIQSFMADLDVCVDLFDRESQYVPGLKLLIEQLLQANLASVVDGAVFMKPSPTLTQPPLMLRHQDGHHLYVSIDLETVLHRLRHWKAGKILYIISGAQSTQMVQVFDAASQLNVDCSLVHVKLGDMFSEGDNTPKNPPGLLKKLALLPCPDIVFPDSNHQKSFLYAAFKMQNLYHNPRFRVVINFDSFRQGEGYVFLKQFAFYRQKYGPLIDGSFLSSDIALMIQEVEEKNCLTPVMRVLKKHMLHMNRSIDVGHSINMLAKILSILGLDNWTTLSTRWDEMTP